MLHTISSHSALPLYNSLLSTQTSLRQYICEINNEIRCSVLNVRITECIYSSVLLTYSLWDGCYHSDSCMFSYYNSVHFLYYMMHVTHINTTAVYYSCSFQMVYIKVISTHMMSNTIIYGCPLDHHYVLKCLKRVILLSLYLYMHQVGVFVWQ